MTQKSQKTALVLLGEGFEEIETLAPIDLLRRAGIATTTASVSGAAAVKGRCGVSVLADVPLGEILPLAGSFDLLVIPGGPGVLALRKNEVVLELVRKFAADGRWIGAICAAPLVVHDAGVLAGHRFTAHDSVWGELPAALGNERVVRDGKLVTSRGAGTALDFALELVRVLAGEEMAAKLIRDVMA
jgi:4-methyl-5(b-hydroxyethyl)-thiazole monophosphate biosynthesis